MPVPHLALAAALLLAGCAAAGPAPSHDASHAAAPQAAAAPHHVHGDALPEAAPVYAPSGVPAAHASHGHAGHAPMNHAAHASDHAAHGDGEGEGCQMACCQDGACQMGCCGDGGSCADGTCGGDGHGEHGAHAGHVDLSRPAAPAPAAGHAHHAHGAPAALPADAQRAVREALDAYLAISDRLAGDTLDGVAQHARALEAAAARLADGHAMHAHADHLATVRAHAAHLAHARDLADARDAFGALSPAFAHLAAAAGTPDGMEVTRFVCGMADAPEGGVWLQRGSEPRNPYFGAAMLRCHRSQETL